MYAVRLIGTDRWIMRTPGHSKVVDGAGSTWASPPKNLDSFYNGDVYNHVCDVEHLAPNSNDLEACRRFEADPAKYLEIVPVRFVVKE